MTSTSFFRKGLAACLLSSTVAQFSFAVDPGGTEEAYESKEGVVLSKQEEGRIAILDSVDDTTSNAALLGADVDADELLLLNPNNDATLQRASLVGAGAPSVQSLMSTEENGADTSAASEPILDNQADASSDFIFINPSGEVVDSIDIAGLAYNFGTLDGTTTVNGEQANLNNGGTHTIDGTEYSGTGTITHLVVYSGMVTNSTGSSVKHLTIGGGTVSNESGGTVNNTVIINGTLNNSGAIVGNVTVTGNGSLNNNAGGTIDNDSDVVNDKVTGNVFVYGGGIVNNYQDAHISELYLGYTGFNSEGTLVSKGYGTGHNYGTIDYVKIANSASHLTNHKGGVIATEVVIQSKGTFNNFGKVTSCVVNSGGIAHNYAGDGGDIDKVQISAGEYHHYGAAQYGSTEDPHNTLDKLTINTGRFVLESGELTIEEIYNCPVSKSTVTVESVGKLILDFEGDKQKGLDTLVNNGATESTGDLIIYEAVTGRGNLTVADTLTLGTGTDVQASTAKTIETGRLVMEVGSLELNDLILVDTQTENTASNLTAGKISIQQSSTLNVTGQLQASTVVINADHLSGTTMVGKPAIVTTDSLTVDGGMKFQMTEEGLTQLGLTNGEGTDRVTLLDILGDDCVCDAGEFSLEIVDANGKVIKRITGVATGEEDGYYYLSGNYGYHFDVVYENGKVSNIDIYLAKVPEPSTAVFSLLAMTALLARRKRRAALR